MKLEQDISKDYEPIEPESYFPKRIKRTTKKICDFCIIGSLIYTMLFTPLITAITIGELQRGKTKFQLEKNIEKDIAFIPNFIEKPAEFFSKPGRQIGYYLYDKRIRLE